MVEPWAFFSMQDLGIRRTEIQEYIAPSTPTEATQQPYCGVVDKNSNAYALQTIEIRSYIQ